MGTLRLDEPTEEFEALPNGVGREKSVNGSQARVRVPVSGSPRPDSPGVRSFSGMKT